MAASSGGGDKVSGNSLFDQSSELDRERMEVGAESSELPSPMARVLTVSDLPALMTVLGNAAHYAYILGIQLGLNLDLLCTLSKQTSGNPVQFQCLVLEAVLKDSTHPLTLHDLHDAIYKPPVGDEELAWTLQQYFLTQTVGSSQEDAGTFGTLAEEGNHLFDQSSELERERKHMGMPPSMAGAGRGVVGSPGGPGGVEVWFEHKTADGRMYYSHPQTQKTTWERPPGAHIVPQPPAGTPLGKLPGLPPPFPLPHLPGMPGQGQPQIVPTRVWSEHQTPEGKTYFYSKVTQQSVWEKPKDFELVMFLPTNFGGPSDPGPQQAVSNERPSPQPHSQTNRPPPMAGGMPTVVAPSPGQTSSATGKTGASMEAQEVVRQGVEAGKEERKEEEEDGGKEIQSGLKESPSMPSAETSQDHTPPSPAVITSLHEPTAQVPMESEPHPPPKPEPKGPRPISSVPVVGTPWSVVWTSDERMFFFDAISRVSVWSIPEELAGNPLVHKIVDEPPWSKKRVGELKEPAVIRPRLEDDDNSDTEGGDNIKLSMEQGDVSLGPPGVVETGQVLTESAETEKKASQIRAGKTPEDRQRLFKEMLLERGEVGAESSELSSPTSRVLTVSDLQALMTVLGNAAHYADQLGIQLDLSPDLLRTLKAQSQGDLFTFFHLVLETRLKDSTHPLTLHDLHDAICDPPIGDEDLAWRLQQYFGTQTVGSSQEDAGTFGQDVVLSSSSIKSSASQQQPGACLPLDSPVSGSETPQAHRDTLPGSNPPIPPLVKIREDVHKELETLTVKERFQHANANVYHLGLLREIVDFSESAEAKALLGQYESTLPYSIPLSQLESPLTEDNIRAVGRSATHVQGGRNPVEEAQSNPAPAQPAASRATPSRLTQTPQLCEFTYLEDSSEEDFVKIIDEVQAEWPTLSAYFKLPPKTTDNIRAMPNFGPRMACEEVFKMWLDGGTREYRQPKQWKTVIKAIGQVLDNQPLADKVHHILTT